MAPEGSVSGPPFLSRYWFGAVAVLWLCCAAAGLSVLWQWDNAAGESASAPKDWPATSHLVRATDSATLVMLAHPHCSCTRASLGELAEVLARSTQHPKAIVVFLKPATFGDGWEQTDLWQTATHLPNVAVIKDDEGREAQAFGAATSGQTLLYDKRGALQFSGGITGARAHQGDNAGRQSLVALLSGGAGARSETSVFGCPLFAHGS